MHMDYTDNLGYCKDSTHHYYSTAKAAFNALNDHQRLLFTTNSAYSLEWARLQKWAYYNDDALNGNNLLESNNIKSISYSNNQSATTIIVCLSVISSVAALLTVSYFFIKRKKER